MRSRDRSRYRPEAEEENDEAENHCPSVDNDTKDTRKMKRSPDKLISLAYLIRNVCRLYDSTGTSTPEEKALCDDVRSVEAAYTEGYDIVEGRGGADVDQADEAGDERRYQDGEERDGGLGLNLQGVSQESEAIG